MTHIQLIGNDALMAILAKGGASIVPTLAIALTEEAHMIFRISQYQVPFRKGILKASGRVSPPTMSPTGVDVEISYGGAASAYAWIMHNPPRQFNYRNGKKSHYLSDPVEDALPGMEFHLARRIERILGI